MDQHDADYDPGPSRVETVVRLLDEVDAWLAGLRSDRPATYWRGGGPAEQRERLAEAKRVVIGEGCGERSAGSCPDVGSVHRQGGKGTGCPHNLTTERRRPLRDCRHRGRDAERARADGACAKG